MVINNMNKTQRTVALAVVGFLVLFVLTQLGRWLLGLKDKELGSGPVPVHVKTLLSEPRSYEDYVSLVGTIKGSKEVDLQFAQAGQVERFWVQEGQKLKKGQKIVNVDQEEAGLALEKAQMSYRRAEKFFELGEISENKLREAQLDFRMAKMNFAKTEIRAPYDGIMGSKYVNERQWVNADQKVGSFIVLDGIYLESGLIEKYAGKVLVGQPAVMALSRYPNKTFQGHVASISPKLEGRSRTMMTKIALAQATANILPGMFATAKVLVFHKQNVHVWPKESVKSDREGSYVFVVDHKRQIAKQHFELLYSSDDDVVANAQDLPPSLNVIVSAAKHLQVGQSVQ